MRALALILVMGVVGREGKVGSCIFVFLHFCIQPFKFFVFS